MKKIILISPLEEHLEGFSYIMNVPRHGTIIVATALRNAGYDVKVFSEFVRCKLDWSTILSADYICFSILSYNALKGYQVADMIKVKTNIPIIFGGSHASVLPQDCLKHCDFAVRNEGEETVIELIKTLDQNKSVEKIKGISYKTGNGEIVHNPDREFMKDIDMVSDISLIENYHPITITDIIKNYIKHKRIWVNTQVLQTSRGCPHNCTFCFGRVELGKEYRLRSIDSVINDIKAKIEILKCNWFYIIDNEFTVNRTRTIKLLERIIKEFGNKLNLLIFARIEIGKDKELLRLMKKAGVYRIYLGIESTNNSTLKEYNKKQTIDDIKKYIESIYSCDLEIFASLVFGGDEDTKETIRDTFDFLIDYDVSAVCLLSIYDFPYKEKTLGIPQVFRDNRFIHNDWRFYNGNFVIHYPKKMKPSTLQLEIINGTKRFYSKIRKYKFLLFRGNVDYIAQAYSLKTVIQTMEKYVNILRQYEVGLYDTNENLIEGNLPININPELKKYHLL